MRIYISGPISGMPDLNREAFANAATYLRARGNDVVSPHEIISHERAEREAWEWADYMREDIKALMTCDAIYMLDGWERSKGARIEHMLARQLGFVLSWDADRDDREYDSMQELIDATNAAAEKGAAIIDQLMRLDEQMERDVVAVVSGKREFN